MPETTTAQSAVIIPAAGSGLRMGLSIPKQFIRLRGIPMLIRTVNCFAELDTIHPIVLALPREHIETAQKLLEQFLSQEKSEKIIIVAGGKTRQDSVMEGIKVLPPEINIVLVHDGARPFINSSIIQCCLKKAIDTGAAVTAIPVRDTIKHANSDWIVTATVDRQNLWQAQTPQAARRELLEKAYVFAEQSGFQGTDEASLLEHAGYKVSIVQGSEFNIKITRQDDLRIAEGLLMENSIMKVGHGFDAHSFKHGRKLVLGGVSIPFDRGLAGHSDADVLTHALIDSILGAMGEDDIGTHFPDKDPRYKNISSLKLLHEIIEKMQAKGFSICNADITAVCQNPRLSPFIDEMRKNIAETCRVSAETINVKATTTEMMGFTGRGEGIAAYAVTLLQSTSQSLK